MLEIGKYITVFLVGALMDFLFNKFISSQFYSLDTPLGVLKNFYTTLPAYKASLWAGLLFTLVYFISNCIYHWIRPSLPKSMINIR